MNNARPRVYLAAPLFNERERRFNLEVAGELESVVDVFVPQRDGALLVELVDAGVAINIAEQQVFEQDARAMGS